ncbi:MAG: peptidoglycan editing factor PgeF [Proteobacteria bacterium]|nr:peptidoglycan editing factor PgeF [Pseudomonadota bacterium]
MISFLQSKNLSNFLNLEHGFLKKDQVLTPTPYFLHQIHSNKIVTLDSIPSKPIDADGMVTKKTHLALGLKTADCVPVLLYDPEASVIGALHAGWKGARQDICRNCILEMEKLGSNRTHMIAALGPSISQESYEVGPEFWKDFHDENPENDKFFSPSGQKDHFLFDLKGYVVKKLQDEGILNIEVLPFNTYTSSHLFHSYRKATHEGLTRQKEYNPDKKPNNVSFIKLK